MSETPAHPTCAFSPADVCAALGPLIADERRARIDRVLATRLCGLTVVLENLHDPHNGAAALRSCEAVGLGTVHAVEQVERFRFSSKVTQGCERWLGVMRYASTDQALAALRAAGLEVAAAVPGAPRTLADLDPIRPRALWFGNEHEGVSPVALAGADLAFALPMWGMTRSLNLSVAVALATFEAAARRRAALGTAGDVDELDQARLRARWYFDDLRGAEGVLRRAGLFLEPADRAR